MIGFPQHHPPRTMDDHIETTKRAMLRQQQRIDAMIATVPRWACCPGCAIGRPFTAECDRFERQGANLQRMLRKRGRLEDLKLAEAVEGERWPP